VERKSYNDTGSSICFSPSRVASVKRRRSNAFSSVRDSTTEVKNVWSCTSIHQYGYTAWHLGVKTVDNIHFFALKYEILFKK
jgi:hypothetical protein